MGRSALTTGEYQEMKLAYTRKLFRNKDNRRGDNGSYTSEELESREMYTIFEQENESDSSRISCET